MANGTRRPRLKPEEEQEIAELYASGEDTGSILETFDIGEGTLYRTLGKLNIPTRRGRNSKRLPVQAVIPPEDLEQIAEEERHLVPVEELAVRHAPPTTSIVVDKDQFVQTVEYVKPHNGRSYTWEIKYTGVLMIEAETIVEAIAEANRVPAVRRIYGARIK